MAQIETKAAAQPRQESILDGVAGDFLGAVLDHFGQCRQHLIDSGLGNLRPGSS